MISGVVEKHATLEAAVAKIQEEQRSLTMLVSLIVSTGL
jgi:hypothetical protein